MYVNLNSMKFFLGVSLSETYSEKITVTGPGLVTTEKINFLKSD